VVRVQLCLKSDAPANHSRSLKVQTTSAAAATAATYMFLEQRIEAQNVTFLSYGSLSAQSLTLSFWVKSNLTGVFTVNLTADDAGKRIASTVTINSAGTWEQKVVTFVGDTVSAINHDNGVGFGLEVFLAAGSNFTTNPLPTTWSTASNLARSTGITIDVGASASNYFQITGVQLEVGDTATPFEHRSYGQELALCQRYYERINKTTNASLATGAYFSGTAAYCIFPYAVTKRAVPTCTQSSNSAINVLSTSASRISTNIQFEEIGINAVRILANTPVNTSGSACWYQLNLVGDFLNIDAEL
jgi:hypothetical protein